MACRGVIGNIRKTERGTGELSFEWRIPDFLSLSSEGGDHYTSPRFDAYNGVWRLEIHPKGLSRPSGYACLFLCRRDSGPPITLNVTLGMKTTIEAKTKKGLVQEFSKGDFACCWRGFFLRSELSDEDLGVLLWEALFIICDMKNVVPSVKVDSSTQTVEKAKEARVHTEEIQSWEKQGVEELQKSLKTLLAGGEDSDVVINVRGKEFPVHKAILRVRSPVFQAMFAHDMVEKQSGIITMEDCDQETFPDFLEHVYTGSFEMISASNVFSLYTTSDKYDLSTLKMECAEFMKQNLTVASFCNTIALATKHREKDLIKLATAFFCENSLEIIEGRPEWQTFLQENSTAGNELFIKALRHNRNK